MGKKSVNSWLNAVKKAFRSPEEKRSSRRRREENEQEEEEKKRGNRRWIFRKHSSLETTIQHNVAKTTNTRREDNLATKKPTVENSVSEQRRAIAVAMATTAAAEAAVATAQAAVEIIRLRRPSLLVEVHKAAVVIQTTFRGYLARRALLALKGVVKLQALIRGHNVRKRAKTTLQCIQSLVRVQALVCDQRRRLSCESTSLTSIFSQLNTSGNFNCGNRRRHSSNLDGNSGPFEEIQGLIHKAKECPLKQTLAHILSQQIQTLDEDQFSDINHEEQNRSSGTKPNHPTARKDLNLCIQKDPIKTVEIDTSRPYLYTSRNFHRLHNHSHNHDQYLNSHLQKHHNCYLNSPKIQSSSHIESRFCSPCHQAAESTPNSRSIYLHRMSMSENSCPLPQPSYMAATASAMARVRSNSTPRQRPSSPRREMSSVKKRLSYPVHDGHNVPDYCTD